MLTTSRPILNLQTTNTLSFHLTRFKVKSSVSLRRHHAQSSSVDASRAHNLTAPISRLPEFILRKIFTYVASESVGKAPQERLRSPSITSPAATCPWSWVCLSYVCHEWRKLMLAWAEIWRFVDFSHPKWYSITLARAKMQPLEICAVLGRHNIQQVHRTLQLAHRIGRIDLDSSLHHIHPLLATLSHPNPVLQSTTVRINTAGHGVEDRVYDEPAFPMIGPALREMKYLELHSAPFYLVSPRYPSLTSLHLHDLTPCQRPSLRHFLHAISQYPELENLTLDNAFPIAPTPSPPEDSELAPVISSPTEPRLQLPQLRRLKLSGSIADITLFLDSVFLPPQIQLSCTITSLIDWERGLPKLGQALSVHSYANLAAGYAAETLVLSSVTHKVYPTVMIGKTPQGDLPWMPISIHGARIRVLTGTLTTESSEHLWLDLSIGPDLSNPAMSTEDMFVQTLTTMWSTLPLSRIETLVLRDFDIVTQKSWARFFKDLPSVRKLDIVGHAPSGFVWALLLNAKAVAHHDTRAQSRQRKREERRAAKSPKTPNSSPPASPQLPGGSEAGSPASQSFPLPPTSPLSPFLPFSRQLFLPLLADVYIRGVDCSSGGYMMSPNAAINSYSDLDDSRFLDVLLACLRARQAAQSSPPTTPNASSRPASPAVASSSEVNTGGLADDVKPNLRRIVIARCSHASRTTVLQIRDIVNHLVWDQQGMIKDDDATSPGGTKLTPVARYRRVSDGANGRGVRHYYRLETLMQEL